MLAIVGVVVGGAGMASAASKPKQESAAKYAKTVCSTYQGLLNDITTFGSGISALDPTDPTGFQTSATTQTNMLLGEVKAAEQKLAAAYPDISNGKKVGKLLSANATELDSLLTSAESQLSAGGIAGATQFTSRDRDPVGQAQRPVQQGDRPGPHQRLPEGEDLQEHRHRHRRLSGPHPH